MLPALTPLPRRPRSSSSPRACAAAVTLPLGGALVVVSLVSLFGGAWSSIFSSYIVWLALSAAGVAVVAHGVVGFFIGVWDRPSVTGLFYAYANLALILFFAFLTATLSFFSGLAVDYIALHWETMSAMMPSQYEGLNATAAVALFTQQQEAGYITYAVVGGGALIIYLGTIAALSACVLGCGTLSGQVRRRYVVVGLSPFPTNARTRRCCAARTRRRLPPPFFVRAAVYTARSLSSGVSPNPFVVHAAVYTAPPLSLSLRDQIYRALNIFEVILGSAIGIVGCALGSWHLVVVTAIPAALVVALGLYSLVGSVCVAPNCHRKGMIWLLGTVISPIALGIALVVTGIVLWTEDEHFLVASEETYSSFLRFFSFLGAMSEAGVKSFVDAAVKSIGVAEILLGSAVVLNIPASLLELRRVLLDYEVQHGGKDPISELLGYGHGGKDLFDHENAGGSSSDSSSDSDDDQAVAGLRVHVFQSESDSHPRPHRHHRGKKGAPGGADAIREEGSDEEGSGSGSESGSEGTAPGGVPEFATVSDELHYAEAVIAVGGARLEMTELERVREREVSLITAKEHRKTELKLKRAKDAIRRMEEEDDGGY